MTWERSRLQLTQQLHSKREKGIAMKKTQKITKELVENFKQGVRNGLRNDDALDFAEAKTKR